MNAIVMRYAEVLLMYAECKIELNQIDNSVYDILDDIRTRAKMPVVDRTRYTGQEKLRELLRRERRGACYGRTSVVRYLPLENR